MIIREWVKEEIIEYKCDMCLRKSTNSLDVERVRIPILNMVSKEPYIFMQEMDLCRECAKRTATIAETALNKFEFLKKFGN